MNLKEFLLLVAEVRYLDVVLTGIGASFLFVYYWNFSLIQYVGLLIFLIGLVIWILGRIHIKGSYSVIPEAKKLITSGIYSKLTHPIYVGSVLTFSGLAIFNLNVFLIIFAIFLFMIQIKRASIEERVLTKKFKDKYLEHKKKTWF